MGKIMQKICIKSQSQTRDSRIRNLGTHFSMHLITFLHTQLCTSHFLHLYSNGLFHSPSTQNLVWVSRLFITEKETTNIFSDISLDNAFFWVLEEMKEISPSQILYNKLEKYLSLSIYKNTCFIHIRLCFFNGKQLQYCLQRRVSINTFNTFNQTDNNRRKITQYDVNTHKTVFV